MRRPRHIFRLGMLVLIIIIAAGCTPRSGYKRYGSAPAPGSTAGTRANPGYLQQLEKQSLLANSGDMAKIISGSELAWRASASRDDPDAVFKHADIWVSINPMSLLTSSRRTSFDQMTDTALWAVLREAGVKGIYMAPMFGSGSLWAESGQPKSDMGDDAVSFHFSPTAGNDAQYRRFMGTLVDNSGLVGSDLIPAATGIGPDFFLAARNFREYPGVYCMLEVPENLWPHLPPAASEWANLALNQEQIASLSKEKILPQAMLSDLSPFTAAGGWAATGQILGIDGVKRRWVYRYFRTPAYPVLNWEDPSRTAHRILSGAAVHQVGMLGQAFVGLHLEPFQGLEAASKDLLHETTLDNAAPPDASAGAAPADKVSDPAQAATPARPEADKVFTTPVMAASKYRSYSLEPALPAAQSLSREIRRYGGWSWLRDDGLPLPALQDFLRFGTDFVTDNAFSPAAEHALLTGNASLLRFMADELLRLKVDTRRLIHTMPMEDGIDYSLPHLEYLSFIGENADAASLAAATRREARAMAAKQYPVPYKDAMLYTTGTGLAAMALDLPLNPAPGAGIDRIADVTKNLKNKTEAIGEGHALLLFFKTMQPGIVMLNGQDLVGALPLTWSSMVDKPEEWDVSKNARGAYALSLSSSSFVVTQQGMPRAQELYPPAEQQVHSKKSFLRGLGEFLRVRSALGLAKGTIIARPATKSGGVIALLSRMPDGESYVLSVCNFSRETVTESISLSGYQGLPMAMTRITAMGTTEGSNYSASGTTIFATLGPWQGKAFYMGKAAID